jgi:4-hydroxybenzoate polyprenyltransferase
LLDGVATVAIALLAGADPLTAVRLGGSMAALQASIGALNDVIDAPTDAGRKPGKPIPGGLVSPVGAHRVIAVGASVGLLFAAVSGPSLLAVAVVVLAIGYTYDLRAKGTAWSWLPFALGIPLLPVFAWFGATRGLPGVFGILLPAAVATGAALAIANARADVERDLDAGHASVATRLGSDRAWAVTAALHGIVLVVALGSLWLAAASLVVVSAAIVAGLVVTVGVVWARSPAASAARRERAWEIQAIGVALLAAAWLAGVGNLG